MNCSVKLLVALLFSGVAMAVVLAAQPRAALPTAFAQSSTVEVTLVDTDFEASPVGGLPSPFLAASFFPTCSTDSVVAVSDDTGHSGSRSLKVQHGCTTSGTDITATGWTLNLPQYAPIQLARLTLHRKMMPDGVSYLGIPGTAPSYEFGLMEWTNGFVRDTVDNLFFEPYTEGVFTEVEAIWDFETAQLQACIGASCGIPISFQEDPADHVTGYARHGGTTFYDDDVKLSAAFVQPETVVIDGCDTGVANTVLEDGGTIFDLVMTCAVGAGTHGEFESCVADLKNMLQKSQVISANQKGAIQSCAAQANIP